jgi:hypothetical protein
MYLGDGGMPAPRKEAKLPDYDQLETEWIVRSETGRPKKYLVLTKKIFYDSLKRVMR